MKIINPCELLAQEHEPWVSNRETVVARGLSAPRKRHVPSLAAHRIRTKMLDAPSELLIREERDRR